MLKLCRNTVGGVQRRREGVKEGWEREGKSNKRNGVGTRQADREAGRRAGR